MKCIRAVLHKSVCCPPCEVVVAQGHGTDRQLLVSIKYGEAVFRDGKARMGRVLQEMEERACTGEQTALQFC